MRSEPLNTTWIRETEQARSIICLERWGCQATYYFSHLSYRLRSHGWIQDQEGLLILADRTFFQAISSAVQWARSRLKNAVNNKQSSGDESAEATAARDVAAIDEVKNLVCELLVIWRHRLLSFITERSPAVHYRRTHRLQHQDQDQAQDGDEELIDPFTNLAAFAAEKSCTSVSSAFDSRTSAAHSIIQIAGTQNVFAYAYTSGTHENSTTSTNDAIASVSSNAEKPALSLFEKLRTLPALSNATAVDTSFHLDRLSQRKFTAVSVPPTLTASTAPKILGAPLPSSDTVPISANANNEANPGNGVFSQVYGAIETNALCNDTTDYPHFSYGTLLCGLLAKLVV